MTTYATLCLGTRQDAVTWEKGNEGLGFTKGISIRKSAPSHDEIKGFFASDAQWLYLGGHFGGNTLYNEADTVSITFEAEQVVAKTRAWPRPGWRPLAPATGRQDRGQVPLRRLGRSGVEAQGRVHREGSHDQLTGRCVIRCSSQGAVCVLDLTLSRWPRQPNQATGEVTTIWYDRNEIPRFDIHRPGNKGGSEIEEDFHAGKARLVKSPGQKASLERSRISFWVGATPKDQGREP